MRMFARLQRRISLPPAALLLLTFAVSGSSSWAVPHVSPRTVIELSSDWRFLPADAPKAADPGLADAGWQSVALPHTWNALDGQDGGGDYRRGPSWYRHRLSIPADLHGKHLYFECDAANRYAEVFIDNQKVGTHLGGFSRFRFDFTPWVKPGSHPLLAIKVDNTHRDDSPPLSADFTFFGGLYRGVRLVVVSDLGIDLLDEASPGVRLTTPEISAAEAKIHATVRVRNAGAQPAQAHVRAILHDAKGKVVAEQAASASLPPNSTGPVDLSFAVPTPHLWQGTVDPYLYSCRIEISDGRGLTDAVEQPLGIRSVALDPNRGFLLNGSAYPLHGVNRHQDLQDRGWALSPADHQRDFQIIREMGANTVRLAHYQHAEEVYDICDRLGLVVWAENCLVNNITESPAFYDASDHQLVELIRQNFNHPSIAMWSLLNEITLRPGPDPTALAHRLALTAAREDASRPSVEASMSDEHSSNWQPQALGQNRYFGWYYATAQDFGPWIDRQHATHPTVPFAISEYGAGAAISQHEWPAKQPKPDARFHPEEYQCVYHEEYWRVMKDRPWIWGTFVWAMFDFASDARNEGDHAGRNDKGLVSYDRQTRKDAFYFYQANWTSTPMVHINSHRFTPRVDSQTDIRVYTNTSSVELFLNGRSLGRQKPDELHHCVWPKVILSPGDNTVLAIADVPNGTPVRDECHWQLRPDESAPLHQGN